jgi:hypothetical protein
VWRLTILLAAGCSFQSKSSDLGGSDGGSSDGQVPLVEAAVGDANTNPCYGTGGLFVGCPPPPPPGPPLMLMGTIDTDNDPLCVVVHQTPGQDVCMITSMVIKVNGALAVIGMKPLVLIATDTITVGGAGTIEVSSKVGMRGAGANAAACDPAVAAATVGTLGGGGAGGTFGGAGGSGGTGGTVTAAGGMAPQAKTPTFVRGGCSGAQGGGLGDGGGPGDGAGAIYLIAVNKIQLDGTLLANGAGAGPGGAGSGGGGGAGSGGLIGLMAPAITLGGSGGIFANGGGGGGGGAVSAGGGGSDAKATTTMQAGGGNAAGGAGGGGAGGVNTTIAANGQTAGAGGGGGGGAVGYIYVKGPQFTGQTSPTPSFQ